MQEEVVRIRDPLGFAFDPSCVLYLPLWKRDASIFANQRAFMSGDAYGHRCLVLGALWTPQGYTFDGTDDYIDCGSSTALAISGAGSQLTVIAWIKPETPALTYARIVARADAANEGYFLAHGSLAGSVFFTIKDVANASLTSTNLMVMSSWNHVAGVYDGYRLKIYLQGLEDSRTAADYTSGVSAYAGGSLLIGKANTVDSRYIKGIPGEVAVLNRGLTPLQIQRHFLATKWRYS